MAPGARQRIQPPHQPARHGDGGRWAGGRPRPAEDKRRSFRHAHPRHAQQLRRRSDAVGHLSHRGGEFPRLFLDAISATTGGKPPTGLGGAQAKSYERYGVPGLWQAWGKFIDRFNVDKEPNEPNRFGWIVEIDPFDPHSVPVKHTALGRFRHEGAETVLNKDGRVVVYCGDDARFDYVYRFVSAGAYDPERSRGEYAPAVGGNVVGGAVRRRRTACTGCRSYSARARSRRRTALQVQADVVIDARLAADLLGATRMDRPEDVQPNPVTGKVYVILTNNEDRAGERGGCRQPAGRQRVRPYHRDDAAGRRPCRRSLRLGDAGPLRRSRRSPRSARCGTRRPRTMAGSPAPTMPRSMRKGGCGLPPTRASPGRPDGADGLYALETEGARRRTAKLFFRCPVGAEMCGPCFTPDQETLFVAVQHPGRRRHRPLSRASSAPRPSRTRPPAGRISSPTCRRGPRCSPSPSVGGGKIA